MSHIEQNSNPWIYRQLEAFGRLTMRGLNLLYHPIRETGRILIMLYISILTIPRKPIRWREMIEQMQFIGVGSLFIVVLTALFSGMVFALQSGRAFALFRAETLTGAVVTLTLSRELAPTLTALMVTARAGSAMSAQIGTMQITQQIDALRSMAVSPIDYLIAPRVVAAAIVFPLLTSIFNIVGILGAYFISINLLGINHGTFVEKIRYYTDVPDFVQGIFKSIFFGIIMAIICCYKGYSARKGAADVGVKVTEAVVVSSVAILVADYFLTAILF